MIRRKPSSTSGSELISLPTTFYPLDRCEHPGGIGHQAIGSKLHVFPPLDCSHLTARPGAGCPILSSRSNSVLNTGTTAVVSACARAGTIQFSEPSDGSPLLTVPSGFATASSTCRNPSTIAVQTIAQQVLNVGFRMGPLRVVPSAIVTAARMVMQLKSAFAQAIIGNRWRAVARQ